MFGSFEYFKRSGETMFTNISNWPNWPWVGYFLHKIHVWKSDGSVENQNLYGSEEHPIVMIQQ